MLLLGSFLYRYNLISANPIKLLVIYMLDLSADAILLDIISSGAQYGFTNIANKLYNYYYSIIPPVPTIVFTEEFNENIFIDFENDSDWIHVDYQEPQTGFMDLHKYNDSVQNI